MRTLILLLVGALLGAVAFHAYYLRLAPAARCGWDHPIDEEARASCRAASAATGAHGYAAKARHDLDTLIGRVAH
jgi:hypothetical protein